MNSRAFFELVRSMREAQRAYFKSRSGIDLSRSKAYERQIDEEIARVDAIIARQAAESQPDLFGGECRAE